MSPRGKKLDVKPTPMVENTLDNVFNTMLEEAKESEKVENTSNNIQIGAKDGVFEPPKVVEEPKIVENDEKVAEETGNAPGDYPNSQNRENVVSVVDELTAILNVQRGKRAVPSLITFFSARSNAYRHVIVDVTDSIVEEAWKKYKEMCPNVDEEEFMGIIYKILNTDVPRMYRAVAPVTLKK